MRTCITKENRIKTLNAFSRKLVFTHFRTSNYHGTGLAYTEAHFKALDVPFQPSQYWSGNVSLILPQCITFVHVNLK